MTSSADDAPATIAASWPAASESASRSRRLHGWDALRGLSAVLVVLLHASVPYLVHPMPGLLWATTDRPSPAVDAVFWWIEGFIMPVFFVLAGYFALGLWQRLGSAGFLKHRVKRVLLPLLFGCVVVLPLDLYTWTLGLVIDGVVPARKLKSLKFDDQIEAQLSGLSHLWFLQYLFLLCALLCGGHWCWQRWGGRERFSRVTSLASRLLLSPYKTIAIAIPCAAILYWSPEVMAGFQHSYFPVPAKFAHSALFFFVGVWLAGLEDGCRNLQRFSTLDVVLGIACFAFLLPLVHQQNTIELATAERLLFASAAGLFASLTTFGLLGLFLRRFRTPRPSLSYLAEASFWIYLIHHPLVGLTQITLAPLPLVSELKCLLVLGIVLALSLMTYQVAVRKTWIGVLLSGRRLGLPEAPATLPLPVPAEPAERREAA